MAVVRGHRHVLGRRDGSDLVDLLFRRQRASQQAERGAFGHHVWVWGLVDLVLAAVALYGGYSLLGGRTFGRVVGYIRAGLVIVESFLIVGYSPLFGVSTLVLATLVIYALTTTSQWVEPALTERTER
jgi:hypothetical protein